MPAAALERGVVKLLVHRVANLLQLLRVLVLQSLEPLLDHAPGMQPQVTSLCDADGELLVDFVGRFERIGQDLAHVGQVLGLPDVVLRSTNASRRPGDSEAELTPEDRAFLAARFEALYQ